VSAFPQQSDSTPQSLIEDLVASRSSLNWERFLFLYQPLIERWLRQYPISRNDSSDLIQESLLVVVRRLPEFEHNGRTGAFRAWLKKILHLQVLEYFRQRVKDSRTQEIESTFLIEDPRSDPDRLWDLEHDQEIARRLL
jgi:RNA polymerase sigma-70 factor, ECF subfamily